MRHRDLSSGERTPISIPTVGFVFFFIFRAIDDRTIWAPQINIPPSDDGAFRDRILECCYYVIVYSGAFIASNVYRVRPETRRAGDFVAELALVFVHRRKPERV